MVKDTRDQLYTYKGKTTVLKAITGGYCTACDESITDMAETERTMAMISEFKKQVDAGTIDLD